MLACSPVTESVGEPVTEPVVFLCEPADAFGGCLQPGQQRCVGGALACGDGGGGRTPGGVAEPFNFRAEVGLGVEEGPGNAGVAGDGFEGDRGTGLVEFS